MPPFSGEEFADELERVLRADDLPALLTLVQSDLWRGMDAAPGPMIAALTRLPEDMIQDSPGLPILKALCRSMSTRSALLGNARRSSGGSRSGAQLIVDHLSQLIDLRMAGDHQGAADIAESLRERLGRLTHEERDALGSGVGIIYLQSGITALLAGNTLQAISDLRASRALGLEDGASLVVHDATAKLALIFALRGGFAEAEGMAAMCPAIGEVLVRYTHYSAEVVSCLIAVERLDETAERQVLALDIEDPVNEMWPLSLLALGRFVLAEGSPAQALELVTVVRSTRDIPVTGLARDVVVSLTMDAHRRMNQVASAAQIHDKEGDPDAPLTQLAHCRLMIRTGNLAEPEALLSQVLSRPGTTPFFRDAASVCLAWIAALRSGSVPEPLARSVFNCIVRDRKLRAATDAPFEVFQAVAAALPDGEGSALLGAIDSLQFEQYSGPPPRLSRRELEVLEIVRREGSVAAAASALFVSHNTVKTHLGRVYSKLGVHNLEAAVESAQRQGLQLAQW